MVQSMAQVPAGTSTVVSEPVVEVTSSSDGVACATPGAARTAVDSPTAAAASRPPAERARKGAGTRLQPEGPGRRARRPALRTYRESITCPQVYGRRRAECDGPWPNRYGSRAFTSPAFAAHAPEDARAAGVRAGGRCPPGGRCR